LSEPYEINNGNQRYTSFEKNDMTKFLDEQENQRTKKNIQQVQLFQEYILATQNDSTEIENLNPTVLNDYLCSWY
jgi:hypothetical protein